jgi:DNA repair ATPase RecN
MTDDEAKEWNRVCFEFNEIVVQNHHMDLHIEKLEDKLDGLVHANRHFMDRIEQLTSGAGGIMEMKQTIANKEDEIERLGANVEQMQKDLDLVFEYDSNLLDHLKGWK